jgi:hypothetical protein
MVVNHCFCIQKGAVAPLPGGCRSLHLAPDVSRSVNWPPQTPLEIFDVSKVVADNMKDLDIALGTSVRSSSP